MQETDAEILVLLLANDETSAQTFHARSSYKPEEIQWKAKFTDIYVRNNERQNVTIDVRKLSQIERINKG